MSSLTIFDFPEDLERLIIKIAILEYHAIQLTLVSRSIQLWAESLIYARVSLPPWGPTTLQLFLRTLKSRTAAFFTANVKFILLSNIVDPDMVALILDKCRGIQSIVIWTEKWHDVLLDQGTIDYRLEGLQPTCLITSSLPSHIPHFQLPFYNNITHLGIHTSSVTIWDTLCHLPSLTHIACSIVPYSFITRQKTRHETRIIKPLCVLIEAALQKCQFLEVFWLIFGGHRGDFALLLSEGFEDTRVVIHPGSEQWLDFTSGVLRVWDVPEKIAGHQRAIGKRVFFGLPQ